MVPGYQNFAAASRRAQNNPDPSDRGRVPKRAYFCRPLYAWQSNLEQLSFSYLVTFRSTKTGSSALSVQLQTKSFELT
jgi:hypothetical protein